MFSLFFHFISACQLKGSSSRTVHEQRSFERKAEEDDGKVSFFKDFFWLLVLLVFFLCFWGRYFTKDGIYWAEKLNICCIASEYLASSEWSESVAMETGRVTDI